MSNNTKIELISVTKVFDLIEGIKRQYSKSVFQVPAEGSPVDCYAAMGARLACDLIARDITDYCEELPEGKNEDHQWEK